MILYRITHAVPCVCSLPSLPNSCYTAAQPTYNVSWGSNSSFPTGAVLSAPLLLYPPLQSSNFDGLIVLAGNDSIVFAMTGA